MVLFCGDNCCCCCCCCIVLLVDSNSITRPPNLWIMFSNSDNTYFKFGRLFRSCISMVSINCTVSCEYHVAAAQFDGTFGIPDNTFNCVHGTIRTCPLERINSVSLGDAPYSVAKKLQPNDQTSTLIKSTVSPLHCRNPPSNNSGGRYDTVVCDDAWSIIVMTCCRWSIGSCNGPAEPKSISMGVRIDWECSNMIFSTLTSRWEYCTWCKAWTPRVIPTNILSTSISFHGGRVVVDDCIVVAVVVVVIVVLLFTNNRWLISCRKLRFILGNNI